MTLAKMASGPHRTPPPPPPASSKPQIPARPNRKPPSLPQPPARPVPKKHAPPPPPSASCPPKAPPLASPPPTSPPPPPASKPQPTPPRPPAPPSNSPPTLQTLIRTSLRATTPTEPTPEALRQVLPFYQPREYRINPSTTSQTRIDEVMLKASELLVIGNNGGVEECALARLCLTGPLKVGPGEWLVCKILGVEERRERGERVARGLRDMKRRGQ